MRVRLVSTSFSKSNQEELMEFVVVLFKAKGWTCTMTKRSQSCQNYSKTETRLAVRFMHTILTQQLVLVLATLLSTNLLTSSWWTKPTLDSTPHVRLLCRHPIITTQLIATTFNRKTDSWWSKEEHGSVESWILKREIELKLFKSTVQSEEEALTCIKEEVA